MRKLLLFVFALLVYVSSFGQSQLLGGEIYYKQLDSFKYELTAQIYRDCRGVAINSINGSVYADSIKLPLNFRRISIENISENCGTNTCININAPSTAGGIEKHVFKDTIDFTQAPYDTLLKNSYCEITFGVFNQGWNNSIWTINNPNFFVDAMVNICHQKTFIHSPEFSNKPLFQACCNQPLRYNPGILKSEDTDSFSFELAGVLDNYNTNAVYSWNLTKTIPMAPYCPPNPGVVNCRGRPNDNPPTGFYFDNIVSDIVFTSTNCNGGLGVIKFQVKQWQYNTQTQKMEIVGYINRQTLVETNTCINNIPPYFSSKTTPPKFSLIDNIYNVCDGDSLILNIATKDDPYSPNQNTYDTTHISWSNNLDNANFTYLDSSAREKTAVLKWKASGDPYQITQKYIHLKTVDKNCNIQTSKGVLIHVYPKLIFKISSKDIKGCNYYQVSTQYSDSFSSLKDIKFDYKIWHINNPYQIIKHINKQTDTFQYPSSGTFVIQYELIHSNLQCKNVIIDTIHLNNLSVIENRIKDTLICQDNEIQLGNFYFKDSSSKITWQVPTGKTVNNYELPYIKIKANKSTQFVRLIVDNAFCRQTSDATIKAINGFDLNIYNNDTIVCKNKNFRIEMKNINSSPSSQILWFVDNQYINNPNTYFDYIYGKLTTVKILQEDTYKCPYVRTINLDLSKIDNFNFNDTKICDNNFSTITPNYLIPSNYIKKYEWYYNNLNLNKDSSMLRYNFKSPANIKLKIQDYYGCLSEKTSTLLFQPKANVQIKGNTNYNYHDYVKLSANENFKAYLWNNNSTSKENNFWAKSLGVAGQYQITLTVKDSNNCEASDTMTINTNQFTAITKNNITSFKLYPNPTDGLFTIETAIAGPAEIHNINGQVMLKTNFIKGKNHLNISHFKQGIYILKFNGKAYKLVLNY